MNPHSRNRAESRNRTELPEAAGQRRRRHHPEGAGPRRGGHGFGGRGFGGPGFGGPGLGGPGFGGRGEGRGRGRAQRGDIRTAALILLAEEPMHGYQLMQAIADRTQGAWRPSPGAIYPTIAQLEDEGLVTVTPDAGRKLVTLTEAGHAYLAANAATMSDPFTAITAQAGGTHDLRGGVEQVHIAARAVGMGGDSAQIAAAQEVLTQARRALYRILADEPEAGASPASESPS